MEEEGSDMLLTGAQRIKSVSPLAATQTPAKKPSSPSPTSNGLPVNLQETGESGLGKQKQQDKPFASSDSRTKNVQSSKNSEIEASKNISEQLMVPEDSDDRGDGVTRTDVGAVINHSVGGSISTSSSYCSCTSGSPKGTSSNSCQHVWKGYRGDLNYVGDGVRNRGAMYSFVKMVIASNLPFGLNLAQQKWMSGSYQPRICMENLEFIGIIDGGSYGQVWQATLKNDQQVAVKQFFDPKTNASHFAEMIFKERDMLIALKTQIKSRIVNIVGAFTYADPFIVMELCLGDLREIKGKSSPRHYLRYAIQMLEGLKFIHAKHIWHLDLRLENIFITTSNNAVLADFGKAMLAKDNVNFMKSSNRLGAMWYTDYEGNSHCCYSANTDIWAAACVIYEIDTGRYLMKIKDVADPLEYGNIAMYGHRVAQGDINTRTTLPTYCTKHKCRFANLLECMLTPTWKNRPDAAELLESDQLKELCDLYEVNQNDLDNEAGTLTQTRLPHVRPFGYFSEIGRYDEYQKSLTAIYYDEMDHLSILQDQITDGESIPLYRPIAAGGISNFCRYINESGNLEHLLNGVKKNDPLAVGMYSYVVNTAFGLKENIRISDDRLGAQPSTSTTQIMPNPRINLSACKDASVATHRTHISTRPVSARKSTAKNHSMTSTSTTPATTSNTTAELASTTSAIALSRRINTSNTTSGSNNIGENGNVGISNNEDNNVTGDGIGSHNAIFSNQATFMRLVPQIEDTHDRQNFKKTPKKNMEEGFDDAGRVMTIGKTSKKMNTLLLTERNAAAATDYEFDESKARRNLVEFSEMSMKVKQIDVNDVAIATAHIITNASTTAAESPSMVTEDHAHNACETMTSEKPIPRTQSDNQKLSAELQPSQQPQTEKSKILHQNANFDLNSKNMSILSMPLLDEVSRIAENKSCVTEKTIVAASNSYNTNDFNTSTAYISIANPTTNAIANKNTDRFSKKSKSITTNNKKDERENDKIGQPCSKTATPEVVTIDDEESNSDEEDTRHQDSDEEYVPSWTVGGKRKRKNASLAPLPRKKKSATYALGKPKKAKVLSINESEDKRLCRKEKEMKKPYRKTPKTTTSSTYTSAAAVNHIRDKRAPEKFMDKDVGQKSKKPFDEDDMACPAKKCGYCGTRNEVNRHLETCKIAEKEAVEFYKNNENVSSDDDL